MSCTVNRSPPSRAEICTKSSGGRFKGVSKNRGGPPKSSILIGFSIINHPFWGPTPIFGNTHMGRSWELGNVFSLVRTDHVSSSSASRLASSNGARRDTYLRIANRYPQMERKQKRLKRRRSGLLVFSEIHEEVLLAWRMRAYDETEGCQTHCTAGSAGSPHTTQCQVKKTPDPMLALRMKVWMLKSHVFPTVLVIPYNLGYPLEFQLTKSANLDLCLERVGVAAVEEAAEAAEARRLPGPAALCSSGHPWSRARTQPLAAMIWTVDLERPLELREFEVFPSTQQIAREIGLPSTKCCLNQELN